MSRSPGHPHAWWLAPGTPRTSHCSPGHGRSDERQRLALAAAPRPSIAALGPPERQPFQGVAAPIPPATFPSPSTKTTTLSTMQGEGLEQRKAAGLEVDRPPPESCAPHLSHVGACRAAVLRAVDSNEAAQLKAGNAIRGCLDSYGTLLPSSGYCCFTVGRPSALTCPSPRPRGWCRRLGGSRRAWPCTR